MERQEVSKTVIEIVKDKVFLELANKIEEETRFKEDLGCDSLDLVDVIIELERKYDIPITDEELHLLNSEETKISDIVDITFNKIRERDARGENMLRHGM